MDTTRKCRISGWTRCRIRQVRVTATPEKWEGHGGAEIGEELILAKDLFKEVIRHHCEEIETFLGSDLIGRSYEPLFPGAVDRNGSQSAWTVIGADWVTTTDGTGVVHTAVMYGEDDYNLGMEVGLPAQHTVGMDGSFLEGTHSELDGRYVKDCDETIIGLLHDGNLCTEKRCISTITHTVGRPDTRCYTMQWIHGS